MVTLENSYWSETEHTIDTLPYVGHLVLHSFSETSFGELDQLYAASIMTESASTFIKTAKIDTDPDLDRVTFTLRLEAQSDLNALRLLSIAAIEAWQDVGNDAEDLELVAAHLAYAPELATAEEPDDLLAITDTLFLADRLDLEEFDETTDELRQVDHREVFYKARSASLE